STNNNRHARNNAFFRYSFASFWSRRTVDDRPWSDDVVVQTAPAVAAPEYRSSYTEEEFLEIFERGKRNCLEYLLKHGDGMADLRDVVKNKAEKHRSFYEKLVDDDSADGGGRATGREVAPPIADRVEDSNAAGTNKGDAKRQRKQGVHEMNLPKEIVTFQSVKKLRDNYSAMLQRKSKDKASKDELLAPPNSGYCSSSASNNSDDETREKCFNVRRCGSNDSAVGISDEDAVISSNWGEKSENFDEETFETDYRYPVSPYSPRGSIDHSNVPSRTLIEAKFVPIVERKYSDSAASVSDVDRSGSRRESCVTDDGDETPRYRYWRTPSVVVSDYSDDIMGLTLEDIEYIRSKKAQSSSPDSSAHSSCSNLNYCGSTISGLDAEYVLSKPFRKSSACSTCSTLSGDEELDTLHPYKKEVGYITFISTRSII
ncbi:unnamed protein product, partial [Brassicogethes aeneus]